MFITLCTDSSCDVICIKDVRYFHQLFESKKKSMFEISIHKAE